MPSLEEKVTQPMYIIVLENENELSFKLGIRLTRLIMSIPCDFSNYERVYQEKVEPLYLKQRRNFEVHFVVREPDSIIKDKAQEDQEHGD